VAVWVRDKFLTGLAVVTPLVVTWWILQFVYTVLHGWSLPCSNSRSARVNELAGRQIVDPASAGFLMFEKFVGVLIPLAASDRTGRAGFQRDWSPGGGGYRPPAAARALHQLHLQDDEAGDRMLCENFGGKAGFKRVVYIDYPATGAWMIGFVTGYYHEKVKKKDMAMVFVPGALSPMTGLLLVVEKERLVDAPMSMEEAMKMIFSGGLVGPDSPGSKRPSTGPTPVTVAMPHDLPPGLPVADTDDHPNLGASHHGACACDDHHRWSTGQVKAAPCLQRPLPALEPQGLAQERACDSEL